jgi:trimethylamine--corrinoid protein Co-methyltransferase
MHAGANYIWHSAGWNEAGMHCSVAKFVVDAEQCAMAYRMAEGPLGRFRRGPCRVPDVGPGGHYLGHPHTQANFQRAFFMPELFDNNSIEQWSRKARRRSRRARWSMPEAAGRLRGAEARRGVDEALRDYIARREREIPAMDALNQEGAGGFGAGLRR